MSEIKISNIVIQIQDKKLELTMEQAKELQKILDDAFPKKEIHYIPNNPIFINRYPWWDVTYCGLGGNSGGSNKFGTLQITCKSTDATLCGGNTSNPINA